MPKEAGIGHVRIYNPKTAADLRRLAQINRRSAQAEGLIAIEDRLAAHRDVLKRGPKLLKP